MGNPENANLTQALALAARGFWLFPVAPAAKFPPLVKFKAEATREPEQICEWWTANPNANLGIYTGKFGDGNEALLAVDVDVRGDKAGAESWAALRDAHNLPTTYAQSSPSGGWHAIYRVPAAVTPSTELLGNGLDIKSRGGYVLAAGSVVGDKPYTVAEDRPVALAPQSLIDICNARKPKAKTTKAPPAIDQTAASQRAIEYLKQAAPAVEGQGGDAATYATACRMRDFGIPEGDCLALMLEHWNDRCSPPWEPQALGAKVTHAYTYAADVPGNASPEAVFSRIPAEPIAPAASLPYRDASTLKPPSKREYIIKPLFCPGRVVQIVAPPGGGKTFLAIHTVKCISLGRQWFGQPVIAHAAAYVAGEALTDAEDRMIAWDKEHAWGDRGQPVKLFRRVNFSDPSAAKSFADTLRQIETAEDVRFGFVVVDTLAANSAGDEDKAADMKLFAAALTDLAYDLHLAVMVLHHPPVSAEDNPAAKMRGRGSGSVRGAFDNELTLRRSGDVFQLESGENKSRNAKQARVHFALRSVPIGDWCDGEAINVAVVRELNTDDVRAIPDRPKKGKQLAAFNVLQDAPDGLARDEWQAQVAARVYGNAPGAVSSARFCVLDVQNRRPACVIEDSKGVWRVVKHQATGAQLNEKFRNSVENGFPRSAAELFSVEGVEERGVVH